MANINIIQQRKPVVKDKAVDKQTFPQLIPLFSAYFSPLVFLIHSLGRE
jgi:hypothetical protein